jgi:hypothetical protein
MTAAEKRKAAARKAAETRRRNKLAAEAAAQELLKNERPAVGARRVSWFSSFPYLSDSHHPVPYFSKICLGLEHV